MFGRIDMCDFVLEHPTISRFHAGMEFAFVSCLLLLSLLEIRVCL